VSQVNPKTGEVQVNLHVTSTDKIQESIALLQAELTSRGDADVAVMRDRIDHVEAEIEANGPIPLSLEHLELYLGFLERWP
jgi:hypothetical protein